MRDKLESIIERYNSIQEQMVDQEVLSNPDKLKELAKEYKQLEPIVNTGISYIKILDQIAEGGKLVTVIMQNDTGSAVKYIRKNNQIISQFLFSIEAPSLKSFEKAKKFKF